MFLFESLYIGQWNGSNISIDNGNCRVIEHVENSLVTFRDIIGSVRCNFKTPLANSTSPMVYFIDPFTVKVCIIFDVSKGKLHKRSINIY